jgi:ABC-type amino acid transport system permease subunit
MEEKKQSDNFFINLFKWKMKEEELKNQIENYHTLGFTRSVRKIASALLVLSIIITLILGLLKEIPLEESWLDIFLLGILALFVYKGKKIAIILAMIYWTISKVYQLIIFPQNVIPVIIWWLVYMSVFYQAYQVEKARGAILVERKEEATINYCPRCGAKVEKDAKFCTSCGNKISTS